VISYSVQVHTIPKHIASFFINLVEETMDYRQTNKVSRNDFMQLLLQLKTLGYVKDADNRQKDEEQVGKINISSL